MYRIIGGDGQEYGPVSADALRQWIVEGRANTQSRVRREDGAEWRTLGDFPELAAFVTSLPAPHAATQRPAQTGPAVPTYLAPAILTTLFCCLPFGIPAIVFAAQVNTKLAAGDREGALTSSRKARRWCWLAFGFGLVPILLYLLFLLVMGLGLVGAAASGGRGYS